MLGSQDRTPAAQRVTRVAHIADVGPAMLLGSTLWARGRVDADLARSHRELLPNAGVRRARQRHIRKHTTGLGHRLPHPRICRSAKTLRPAEASKRIHPSLLLPLCRAFAACLPSALSTLCLPTALLRLLVLCCPARPLVRLSAFLGLLDLPAWRSACEPASECVRPPTELGAQLAQCVEAVFKIQWFDFKKKFYSKS